MTKTLGQVAHDAGRFERKWEHMGADQQADWERIAQAVIEAEQAQLGEPVLWVRKDQLNQMASGFLLSAYRSTEGRTDLIPVFTHQAPPAQQVAVPATGERAELIDEA